MKPAQLEPHLPFRKKISRRPTAQLQRGGVLLHKSTRWVYNFVGGRTRRIKIRACDDVIFDPSVWMRCMIIARLMAEIVEMTVHTSPPQLKF